MLLVAQPNYMDLPALPSAAVEAECVQKLVPSGCIMNILDSTTFAASVDSVLSNAPSAHVFHLACHGYQAQDNPLRSGFDLHDGRLTLEQLMGIRMPHAQLAYLSACESAGVDESRPDEGLNLVGAMIHVGFKSVIGTMW
jgi:CHAT domain-containing protein